MAEVDLRRGARMVTALTESDYDAVRLVMVEVQKADRWRDLAIANAVIARIILTRLDEIADGYGDADMFGLWLAAADEQVAADGDAWWLRGLD